MSAQKLFVENLFPRCKIDVKNFKMFHTSSSQFACAAAAGRRWLPARLCLRNTSPVVDVTTAPTRQPGGGGGGGYWLPALPQQPPDAGRCRGDGYGVYSWMGGGAGGPAAVICRPAVAEPAESTRGGAVAKVAGGLLLLCCCGGARCRPWRRCCRLLKQ